MSRISKTFSLLKSNNKKALIPFITAGDPSVEMTKKNSSSTGRVRCRYD